MVIHHYLGKVYVPTFMNPLISQKGAVGSCARSNSLRLLKFHTEVHCHEIRFASRDIDVKGYGRVELGRT